MVKALSVALAAQCCVLLHAAASCENRDRALRVLLQNKLGNMGIPCENMCKEMGAYPKCQCPGFAGMPASADDNRACIAKYCQDPTSPCPNDAFVTCVKENTQVSALQWEMVLAQIDQGFKSLFWAAKNRTSSATKTSVTKNVSNSSTVKQEVKKH